MAPVLADPALHQFTGGAPPTSGELEERYRRQAAGRSADGAQVWLNWVVRRLDDERAIGTVQATVTQEAGHPVAELAWVIGTAYQGQGYGREAARTLAVWLRQHGIPTLRAHVHPEHHASAAVARAVGLRPTALVVDGEVRWESAADTGHQRTP